jgi:hypothetical protein
VRSLSGASLPVALAAVLAACSDGSNHAGEVVRDDLLTDSQTMMGWIADITAQGIRRPGYPASEWIEGWARDRFVELGLEEVTLDPVTVDRWEPLSWSLTLSRPDGSGESLAIPCYPVPFSGETPGVEGEIAILPTGDEPAPDVAGKIALLENEFLALPTSIFPPLWNAWAYDPANEVATHTQIIPFSSSFADVLGPVLEGGGIGFIGILRGLPWETDRYYVPYDAVERPVPAVWVSSSNGDRLLAFLAAGPTRARLQVERKLEKATSHNVTGVLRGASDEWIIIGSHSDGPWASAVEDASGVSLVLAQARYWSRVPQSERPHNLMFLLNSGHMSGGAGLIHFVETHRDFISNQVVLEVHLEHAAREARGENGQLVPTDQPEFRWWFTSWIRPLEEAVAAAICAEDLGRSFIMPPEDFPPGSLTPPTDAAFFHPIAPIVSFLTAPMYLFDEADTIAMIHEPSLVPLTRAAIRIIEAMRVQTAAGLRSQRYTPPRSEPLPPARPLRERTAARITARRGRPPRRGARRDPARTRRSSRGVLRAQAGLAVAASAVREGGRVELGDGARVAARSATWNPADGHPLSAGSSKPM